MLPIRCPQCGLINHADDFSFPRCGQCHDDLVRCGTCAHLESDACVLPAGQRYFTPDLEGAKQCPRFTSRHSVRGTRLLLHIPAPVWMSGMLLLLFGVLLLGTWFIDPAWRYFRGNPIELKAIVPTQVMVGRPAVVTMRVVNKLNRASTRLYFDIGDDFLSAVKPGMPIPEPLRVTQVEKHLLLEYGELPAGGQMILQIPFIPQRVGTRAFSVRIFAPSNQLQQELSAPVAILPSLPAETLGLQKGALHERGR